jgi:hypothetical protein
MWSIASARKLNVFSKFLKYHKTIFCRVGKEDIFESRIVNEISQEITNNAGYYKWFIRF